MARFINNSGDISQVVATRELKAFDIDELLVNSREWVDGGYADDSYAQASVAGRAGLPGGCKHASRRFLALPDTLLCPGYRAANKPGIACEVNGFRVIATPR